MEHLVGWFARGRFSLGGKETTGNLAMTSANLNKSCDPQLISPAEIPTTGWLLSDLTAYAQRQNEFIDQREKSLATNYWMLGLSLSLARKHFSRGQWGKQLEVLGIDKTRASKAMAISRTFADVEELCDKSVDAAYKARARKPTAKRGRSDDENKNDIVDGRTTEENSSPTLRSFLSEVKTQADYWIHEAAFAAPEDSAELLDLLEAALQTLQTAKDYLKKQCGRT